MHSGKPKAKKGWNTKIPRAEVFPVLLFIIGLLSYFLQILFLFIRNLPICSDFLIRNISIYNRQGNKLFWKPTWFKIVKVFWSLKSLTRLFAISCPSLKYDLPHSVVKLKWNTLVVGVYIWICVLDHLKWNKRCKISRGQYTCQHTCLRVYPGRLWFPQTRSSEVEVSLFAGLCVAHTEKRCLIKDKGWRRSDFLSLQVLCYSYWGEMFDQGFWEKEKKVRAQTSLSARAHTLRNSFLVSRWIVYKIWHLSIIL